MPSTTSRDTRFWANEPPAERPGLVLALDCGGSCRGVVFRIAADAVEMETGIIWKSEMVASSYTPRWVRARTTGGGTVERRLGG